MSFLTNMPSTTSVFSAYTSFAASTMVARTMMSETQTIITQIIPQKLRDLISSKFNSIFGTVSSQMTLIIDENNGIAINEGIDCSADRSIIVIEDIDCSAELQDRKNGGYGGGDSQLTLSGVLNTIDGLWSSCGDARIIVFTTNHKEKLDPALLRPGRMDMHVHMTYLTPYGFEILVSNYLQINHHQRFKEIQELIMEVEVTPAEVAEELMKSDDADVALESVVQFVNDKKRKKMEKECNSQAMEKDEHIPHAIEEGDQKENIRNKRRRRRLEGVEDK